MKLVIAPDSFKESLSARAVAEAIAAGWARVYSDAELLLCPMADGGEGTVDALLSATDGKLQQTRVSGPLGDQNTVTFIKNNGSNHMNRHQVRYSALIVT